MRILLLADIHIGSIKDTQYVYNVITDIIDKEVVKRKTDMIVFLGDYFDKLFRVNAEHVSLAINIMSYIVRMCIRGNTKIRMIYGTESHEMSQYKLFNYHITSGEVDLKIIDTVTEECIDGYNILYIPEEYVDNKHKHYAKYLSSDKHYNYIFGHGIIEDGMNEMVTISAENNENDEKHVPRFKSGEFMKVTDLCVFGHYHVYTNIKDRVYYLGSLFRDSFGEEEDKGYGIIEDDKFMFIKNDRAYVYKTYEFGPNSNIFNSTDNMINEINRIKEENANIFNGEFKGKIRLKFNPPNDLDDTFKESLRSLLFNDKYISPIIKESNNKIMDDIKEDIEDEFEFLIDNSLQIEDKIYRVINNKQGYDMSMNKLMSYIGKSLKKIKELKEIKE